MSHFLSDEQVRIRDVAREFAQVEVSPRAAEIDNKDEFPADLVRRAAELGLFGLMIPQEYGGLDAGITTTCVVLEEIGKASPSLAGMLSVQIALCPVSMNTAGTPEQKTKYLVPSASGENLMALSATEPSGMMNTAAHQTRLTPDGENYRLNGLKIFCTQGSATVYIVGGRTSVDGQEGYGAAIVEKGMPGFEVGKYENKLGWRGSNTGTLIFTDVLIPRENILGGILTGLGEVSGLGGLTGNLGHCASALGCAEGMLAKTIEYAKGRELYGQPMTALQPITYWLSEAWVKIEAARSLLYTTTRMVEEGRIDPNMIMACKVHVCETAFEVCNRLLQVWGGHGMMNDTGVHRYMRDARVDLIAEGASETMLSGIAQSILA
ncbi:MAG: acyl-CoA dehydrogenase family protein [Actinobacteria bacterium]|nr:acyl-CoA dehydrogenase family protein [Actinomycetota bacterium]MCG2802420.1 acyl-CoA dehydrogenase family protein [Cellulomonas sp.]